MSKLTVGVLFGGQSSEHEVSLVSANTVISNINKEIYDVVLIGITKDGHWLKVEKQEDIISGQWEKSQISAVVSPDAGHHGVLFIDNGKVTVKKLDVIFPVLHGLYGEDGTVQGLLELAKIPYVGCGVLASSISMDKLYTKIVVDRLNIRQADYVAVFADSLNDLAVQAKRVEDKLSYPVFVKPSNAGSSQGVSKAHNREELETALLLAAKHDYKILVEETIVGREIECAVLGSKDVKASGVGEVIAAEEFYTYDAKYNNEESKTDIHPQLPAGVENQIREAAVAIFKAVDGRGLARVDFFYDEKANEIVFNELNTLPGFTSISMYPMLWEAKGISKERLVEKLIQLGLSRYEE